ncbi:MAG: dihydroorotate dehydrogenase [Anaerolineae bacterium]
MATPDARTGQPEVTVDLAGVHLANPLVLASGIWGSGSGTLIRAGLAGAGAVTSKSCSVVPRKGHPNPTVLSWGHGLINAVGLSNPGAEAERAELEHARDALRGTGVALIASVFGDTPSAFAEAVRILEPAGADLIELNISCPNVESEFGRPFAFEPAAAASVTDAVRRVYGGPLLVKLSPNAPEIVAVARAVVGAGADGLTAVNTLGPGMVIDIHARRPILSNRTGGVSGPALRPVAVRCVYEIAAAVNVPIVGTGGVASGADALEMIMAGATAVGIGSALEQYGERIFPRVLEQMTQLMTELGIASLDEIRGCAHV